MMKISGVLILPVICTITISSFAPARAETPFQAPTTNPSLTSDAVVLKEWAPSLAKHLLAASLLLDNKQPTATYLDGIAFYDISEAYSALGNFAEAEKMASHVRDAVQRSNALGMAGTRKATFDNDIVGAKRFLAVAKTAAFEETDSLSRDKVLSDLVRSYAQIGDAASAKELLPQIKDDSYRIVARLWLAEALAEHGDVSVALENLKEVPANADASPQLLLVIEGYIKAGQTAKARDMVDANVISWQERQVEAIVAITLAEKLTGDATRNSLQPAIKIAVEMEDTEEGDKGGAIEAIAKAQIQLGDLEAAEKLMATVSATSVYEGHVQLAKTLSEAGKIEKAKTLAKEVLKAENGANLNIDMLCEIGLVEWKTDSKIANQTFAEAVKQADAMGKTTSERNWALVRIVTAMAQTKNYRWAEMLTGLINIPRQKSQALTYVAIAEARGGQMDRANETLELALATPKENSVPETVSSIAELVRLVADELLHTKIQY